MDWDFKDLENMKWSKSKSSNIKGPKRMCKFCILAIVVPIVLLCIPLYMRYQALKPHRFTLSPSDMKLLNQESRVSTVWCEGQELSMNGSFNAYLLAQRPKLKRWKQHVTMKRNMMLQDDIKEYWGFYLLKGSTVKLSVCSRYEGASFIVVKGLKDARKCAWMGELDSQEESDEISNEFEFVHQISEESMPNTSNPDLNNPRNESKKFQSFEKIMEQVKTSSNRSEQVSLLATMIKVLKQDPTSQESYGDAKKLFQAFQVESHDPRPNENKDSDIENEESNHGGEVFDDPNELTKTKTPRDDTVYDLFDAGVFNQQDPDGLDRSNEETKSSWSSSEEALAACEGLIFNEPLNGGTKCSRTSNSSELEKTRNSEVGVTKVLEVTESGFYYFIFANENEIQDNFLSAKFDLHKTVFDVSENAGNCTKSTHCELPLAFWSEDHVVLEVPDHQPAKYNNGTAINDPCSEESLLTGFSSLEECHQIIIATSVCKPRKLIYMIFLLLVPVFILFCAQF